MGGHEARGTAALLGGLAVFQGCLAAGAPWGRAAYGGSRPGRLPGHLRAVSAAAALGYAATAATLATGAGSERSRRRVLVGVVALVGPGVLVNAVSRSPVERAVWTPYCALTAASALRAVRRPPVTTSGR